MNNSRKLPTINDVAKQAGVSKRTVSRVINRSSEVNEATRVRVQKVIDELNFAPNRQARGLAASRSYLLGLIYDVPTLFVNDIQNVMLRISEQAGYEVVVHPCHVGSERLIADVSRFISRAHLDGVLVLPPISDMPGLSDKLSRMDCHHVCLASRPGNEPWKQVVLDDFPAIMDMTSHLVSLGHTEIGFISGPPAHTSSQMRHEVFLQALESHGLSLPESMMTVGMFTYDSGVRAARRLLDRKHRPTAIFAANDEMAFGAMNVAHELGIGIPKDLSLVGFDGTPFSTFVVPSLSTIVRGTDEMSRLGTEKLLSMIHEGPDAAREFETKVASRFLPRESTGAAPKDGTA